MAAVAGTAASDPAASAAAMTRDRTTTGMTHLTVHRRELSGNATH
jgi:hypothetical protein